MTALVRTFSEDKRLELSAASFPAFVATVLDADLKAEKAPERFPDIPEPLVTPAELQGALEAMPGLFNQVVPTTRRSLDANELEQMGAELVAIDDILSVITQRQEQIKEFFRVHQDVRAEEEGRAFPHDVVRNGLVVASATPRDAKGHYLLAKPKQPEVTKIPNTPIEISNQFTSGKLNTSLSVLEAMYHSGELDHATYLKISTAKRVIDPEKLRAWTLKTGDASLLAKVSTRALPSSSMNIRGIARLPKTVKKTVKKN